MDTQDTHTILVVDDEELVGMVIARLLTRGGFAVQTATTGAQAIAMVREGIPGLHAVLLDLSMPEMTGDVVAEQITALLPHIPLILMSGYQPEMVAQRYQHLGLNSFLQKPFSRDALYTALHTAIAAAQADTSATPPVSPANT